MILKILDSDGEVLGWTSIEGTHWEIRGFEFVNITRINIPIIRGGRMHTRVLDMTNVGKNTDSNCDKRMVYTWDVVALHPGDCKILPSKDRQ